MENFNLERGRARWRRDNLDHELSGGGGGTALSIDQREIMIVFKQGTIEGARWQSINQS